MNTRQAVEHALEQVGAALRRTRDESRDELVARELDDLIRALGERRRRLVTVPEMPMRITEAQEIQQSMAVIEDELRTATEPFQKAVRDAVQPLREVVQSDARVVNGQLRFPEEWDLTRQSQQVRAVPAAPRSLVARARNVLSRVFSRR